MQNLNFVLMGHQDWDVQSVHTGVIVGYVRFNPAWHIFSFEPGAYKPPTARLSIGVSGSFDAALIAAFDPSVKAWLLYSGKLVIVSIHG